LELKVIQTWFTSSNGTSNLVLFQVIDGWYNFILRYPILSCP